MKTNWKRIIPCLLLLILGGILLLCITAKETYTPSFGFTGGSGRVTILCDKVEMKHGKAMATIAFSSESYTYVKVDGTKYQNENRGGNSTFVIPVTLNGTTEIAAETTAMGEPHEIDYVLYVYVDGTDVLQVMPETSAAEKQSTQEDTESSQSQEAEEMAPEIEGLSFTSTVELKYAECFQIYHYEGGYCVIRVDDGRDYFLVPEAGTVPTGLPSDYIVLRKPLDAVYLQSTASASLFDAVGAVKRIRLSGTRQSGWYVDSLCEAMDRGDILFAGKYSEPDYELLISEGCDMAFESTMLLHNPEVLEKLEEMGIPVFIERASYETHPLGKAEWIKLVGELMDEQGKAQEFFETQEQLVENLSDFENTGKTVAFFYINQNGIVVTRKSSDYLPRMIELAGGAYVFENLGDPKKATSGVNMTMEEFYAAAKDADYLIYNAAIDEPLNTIDELLGKNRLFADFKAVREGNVWSTEKSMHQATAVLGDMIKDLNTMLTDETAEELGFMHRLH